MVQSTKPTGLIANKGIELLTFGTPNGYKAAISLEELKDAYGKDYTVQTIDLFQNVQKEPWYLKSNPNGKIPVIVDHDKGGHAVMETVAILDYLTSLYDPENKFSFEDPSESSTVKQWSAWQHGGLTPNQSQANNYYRFRKERDPYSIHRFVSEVERHYGILDNQSKDRDYITGPGRGKYSTPDIAIWPLVNAAAVTGIELEKYLNLYKWWERVEQRPAVQRGIRVPSGEEFRFGYKLMKQRAVEDPVGTEEVEGPLREAWEKAKKEFGN